MKLKVCGMKYEDNIAEIAAFQPDFLGFIFYSKSPRYFEGKIPKLSNRIKKVGVFVDAPLEDVINTIKEHQLDAVQLHGHETPEYCAKIQHQSVEIIKVFSIKDEFDFNVLEPYEDVCDYFLFDTKGKQPGGNGYTFNWDVLTNYSSTKPYFLSGGIGLSELEKLKEFKNSEASKYCYAIDVNSKFELEPGRKNRNELEQFRHEL